MKQKTYFGKLGAVIWICLILLSTLEPLGVFPFTRTFFFPMLALLVFLVGLVGWMERDQVKWPAMVVTILGGFSLLGWLVLVFLRVLG
jgi:hypothetical protein